MKRPNTRDVNPYDSKALKRSKSYLKRKKIRKDPGEVNPYSTCKDR